MKRTIILLTILISTVATGSAQTKNPADEKIKQKVIALEQAGWQAWKDKNVKWFQENTTQEFLSVNSGIISTRAEVIASTPTGCDAKSFSLADFTFIKLNETAVVLTYMATQDATCGGEKLPAKVRVAVNYVKRNGKWLEAFYTDTPLQ